MRATRSAVARSSEPPVPTSPPLPLFWTFGDVALPFGVRATIVPSELHVRMYREDEPPLGFEALAARQKEPADPEQ